MCHGVSGSGAGLVFDGVRRTAVTLPAAIDAQITAASNTDSDFRRRMW
jgi:hypothetical protein